MEDSGMVPRGGATLHNLESRRTGTQNTWNEAIKRGDFEDEDAAFVEGQQELAGGSLARMRRAADLSYMAVNRSFDFNDRRLRQNHSGQVAPRAQFSRGERGPARAGLTHKGDGPVELRGATPHSRPPHGHAATTSSQRPVGTSRNATLPPITPRAHGPFNPSSASSPAAQPLGSTRSLVQPTAVTVQTSTPQDVVQVQTTTLQFELPDGHSVLFQAPVTFASPTFINRTGEYPGTIYLVNGPVTADDQIVLHINEDRVEDVKRRTKEYVDYLSDSDRLILQFKDGAGCITWFVVIFRQRDVMVSFVKALREFVDRLKQPTPSPTVAPPVSIEPRRDAPAPPAENVVQQDPMRTVSAAILEDIVSWAMHIVAFIRDAGPAELASADALPGIIRGASAAVLMEKHAGFSDLDSKQRVAFVDEVCVPQVFDRFKQRMRPDDAIPAVAPSAQTSSDAQETEPTKHCRPTYTTEKLLQLSSGAVDPPSYLTELRYLPEVTQENRNRIQGVIQQARGVRSMPTRVQAAEIPQRATPQTLNGTLQKPACGLDGSISPSRIQKASSHGSVTMQTTTPSPNPTPSITVTAPSSPHNPEEPLVAIHGEMNGLNSSRHNKSGGDVLGKVAGQFTGVLRNGKSHLADLMLLDGVEDFDVIRTQDPEVAEIADRFARVSFDEGRPN